MTKDFQKSLDLGKLTGDERYYPDVIRSCATGGGRPPPLLPERFAERLEEKRFTNGKDDKPLVAGLYKQAFEEEFGKAEMLNYNNLGWGDAEAIQISELLASGAAPKLKVLKLARNPIGDEGVKALAEAIAGGAAPALKVRAKQHPPHSRSPPASEPASPSHAALPPRPRKQMLNLRGNKASQAAKNAIKAAADERSILCGV